ncbi:MCE family protein [uncultured Mycobacterium sp.]|uniref:MCE family protein n=1 Tax=uncultured Mycobacterium sp. TaxID=171292 RepID=UPI0035C9C609
MLAATGCAFNGLNSLPLPGATGRGPGADIYHVEIPNVGTMEPNSPVMIDDVVVGSVNKETVKAWHADVEISVKRDVVVPANAVARVGQTSLLGSMHLELNPPPGQQGIGRLKPGATIPLNRASTYPSTEQTLSSLSVVVNAGGLGQIGDIIHNFSAALSQNPRAVRDLLVRLDRFVGTLDEQRDNLVASIQGLNRFADTLAAQRDVITTALRKVPPALDVLIRERPRIITALDKLRVFSDTTTRLINDAGADLVKNLQNLEPTIRALADVGPDLDKALTYAPTFPFPQNIIDRAFRGDFTNAFIVLDFTNARLRGATLLGTHWERMGAEWIPAPGEPYYLQYQYTPDPLHPGAPGPVPPPVNAPLTPTAAPPPIYGAPLPPPPIGACNGADPNCPAANAQPPRPIPPTPPGPGAPPWIGPGPMPPPEGSG